MSKILIWGSSSQAGCTCEVIESQNEYEVAFFYDPTLKEDTFRHGFEVLSGSLEELEQVLHEQYVQNVAVAIGDNQVRKRVSQTIKENLGFLDFATLVHESAVVSKEAEVEAGTVIMAGAVIDRYAKVGEGCLISHNCVVSHDTQLEAYVNMFALSSTGGNVKLEDLVVLAANATVIQDKEVACRSIVGANSLVLRDIPENVIAFGAPASAVRVRPDHYQYL